MKLKASETELHGKWVSNEESIIIEDVVSKRINHLILKCLVRISADSSGWNVLYKDENDGRYWELVYNNSASFGGGAPSLLYIPKENAESKFLIKLK